MSSLERSPTPESHVPSPKRSADAATGTWAVTFSDFVLQVLVFVAVASIAGKTSLGPPTETEARVPPAPAPASAVRAAPQGIVLPIERPGLPPLSVRNEEGRPAVVRVETAPEPLDRRAARLRALGRYFEALLAASGQEDDADVSVGSDAVTIELGESISFPSASADLAETAKPLIAQIRALVRSVPQARIEVQGHTDDRPIRTARFPSNLELSLARAAAVTRELVDGDASISQRSTTSGFGADRPIASNDSDGGRARNRRVEVHVIPPESAGYAG